MGRRKDPFWKYAKDLNNGRFSCNYCERDFAGGISRIKSHLCGLKGHDIQICPRVPEEVKLEVQQAMEAIDTPSKRAKSVAASNTVLQGENISGSSSSHMPNLCKGQEESILDMQLARFLRTESTSVDAIESPFFKDFVNGVAKHGPGYQVPRFNLAKLSDLMEDFDDEVHAYVDNVKNSVKTGCTLMCNRHPLVWQSSSNIFLYTPIGVVCIPPDISSVMISLAFEKAMSSIIKLIGPTNIVQLIIYDYEGYGKEVSSICREYPWIYWTPCATRLIELLLHKIFFVPFVFDTIRVARGIGIYIYNNKVNVSYLKKKVNGSFRRSQSYVDRIASSFFMLTSLLEVENELQALQVPITTVPSNWGKPLTEKQLEKFLRSAKFTEYVIRCKEFWSQAKIVAQVMPPIFQALCLVRFEGPTSGYLYEMMECVKDALEQCRDSHDGLYDIWNILVEVRSKIIHPIHAAAAFLNPMYMCSEKFKEDVEMTRGLEYIQKHLVAVEENEDFANQVELYRKKDSNVFTAEAMIKLKTSHPRIWWEHCGNHISVLQKYAIRILSQPCSSSLCHQYESLHRNDPSQQAFKFNAMMMERYKSLKTQIIEPIILDKLEVSDEVNYQLLFTNGSDDESDDEDGAEAEHYEYIVDWFHRYADEIIKDPTGSWLDSLQKISIIPAFIYRRLY